jgi:hypothetical protein
MAPPTVPLHLPAAVLVSQGWRPRLMRASACCPDGFGAPAQDVPSPYARRAEKEPQRTQNKTWGVPLVLASTCPLSVMACAARDALGPLHRCSARCGVSALLTDMRMQVRHLHMPLSKCQSCESPMCNEAPSRALGGLRMRSAGMGGKTCVTLAMVRTTRRDRFTRASRSAIWAGEG